MPETMPAMTKEEYKALCEAHSKSYKSALKATAEKYAMENRSFNIGDIITDANDDSVIKVDEMRVITMTAYPQCVYHGFELTKLGEYRKDSRRGSVWENDARTHSLPFKPNPL